MKTLIQLLALLFVCNVTKATIIHTDINPDITITTAGMYDLDLDNDGTPEYNIELTHVTVNSTFTNTLRILPFNSNEVLSMKPFKVYCPLALSYNDPIGASQSTWYTITSLVMGGYTNDMALFLCNEWNGPIDKYLGLKFKISGQWHYGWARVETDSLFTYFTVKEYAYEDIQGASITAGGVTVNVKETAANDVSAYSVDKMLYINLNNTEIDNGRIKLYNLTGKEIKSFDITQDKMTVNLHDISAGIYLMKIYNKESIITRKVSIR